MKKIKINNKKGNLLTDEPIGLIIAVAAVIVISILLYKLLFPFDADKEAQKSFFTSFVWFPVSFLALVLLIYSIRSISTKIPSFLIVPLLVLILFSLNQIQISGNAFKLLKRRENSKKVH